MAENSSAVRMPFCCKSARRSIFAKISASWGDEAGAKAGYAADLSTWSGAAIKLAVDETKAFAASLRQGQGKQKEVA